MSLHKLSAGDGYTYLTRQVAAQDATERGYSSLGDYYAAKGETPGVWVGGGLESLGVSGAVTEEQMKNLFGAGLHPDAQRLEAEAVAALPGKGRRREHLRLINEASRLGQPFRVMQVDPQWRDRLTQKYQRWNSVHDHPAEEPLTAAVKEDLRTGLANEMFTETYGRPPADAAERSGFLARVSRPSRTSVAGYDLTFSPVKSVSTLWAIAPAALSRQLEDAHQAAVAKTLSWLETEAGYTRLGTNGPAQVPVRGLVMAQFTHRDSRAGDPDLHTHVAVSNKVQTLDGRWLALDARMLYRLNVAASEFYNTSLEAEVAARTGARFAARPDEAGKRVVREIVGVDDRLNQRWSSRRTVIVDHRTGLTADFVARHGRVPTTVEMIKLGQQATLATRETKHQPRSLPEQRDTWTAQAVQVLGGRREVDEMMRGVLQPEVQAFEAATPELIDEVAAATLEAVENSRAHWRESNLTAEAHRQVRGRHLDPAAMADVAAAAVERVLAAESMVPIGVANEVAAAAPEPLLRPDGTSVYTMAKGHLYTSTGIIDAEIRVVAAAGRRGARRLEAHEVQIAALEWSANNHGRTLNTAQQLMVTDIATSDRYLQLALAPAGTGKTTVMGVLARAWTASGGTVVGLAPQASAAQELAAAIPGVDTDTIDKLVHDLHHTPQDRWQPWMTTIGPDSLVIVDEAGLASTPTLDAAVGFVTGRGGRVLLVGDDRQRAAIGAGGLLRDIESGHGALTLTEVLRFTDPLEGQASLALRQGDIGAVGYHADRGRVHAAAPDTAPDMVFHAWAADIAAGADSIMIAPTLATVTALNSRARHARLAALGDQKVGPEITLPNGEIVSAGDTIITKRNNRRLSLGGTDFVRNNHRWTIQQVHPDGAITATETGRHVTRTLPAWYIRQGWVRLGYAHTHASVQGMTIGRAHHQRGTAHAIITAGMTRNDLYPALTRAADGTHSYVILGGDGDPHDAITPQAIEPQTAVEILVAIIERDGSARSVATEQSEAGDPALRLGPAADAYTHAVTVGAETLLGPDQTTRIIEAADLVVPSVSDAPAWETLRGHLLVIAADGRDPVTALTAAAGARELDSSRDVAAVLDYRLDPTGTHSQQPGPLPWLPQTPAALRSAAMWAGYLQARADLVADLAAQIRDKAAAWTPDTAAPWAIPYLSDAHLVCDLAVWRAAHTVPDVDLRPAGPSPRRIAMIRRHHHLTQRALTVGGNPRDGADRWAAVLADRGITVAGDDYWPVLAARLNLADTAGLNVHTLLTSATTGRPLPAEGAAGALWWRLAPHLGDLATGPATGSHRLRPPWTTDLETILGQTHADRITADRLWPVVVARVDTAERDGHHPADLVAGAARMLVANRSTIAEHELPTVLLWHIVTLTDPEPLDADLLPPEDPADADLQPPHDADLPAPVTETDSLTTVPDDRGPDLDPFDPVDADQYAAVPQPADDAFTDINPAPERRDNDPAPLALFDTGATEPAADPDRPLHPGSRSASPAPDDGDKNASGKQENRPSANATDSRIRRALIAANSFYTGMAPKSWVPRYLGSRGLDPAAAGYAPGRNSLVDHLREQGFSDHDILSAGLARTSERGLYDAFRNRLTLPYHHPDGHVVGFLTRKPPGDTNEANPKYLNTAESELFHKRALPYGLDTDTVAALRGGADLVLVEGPMDAIAINTATGRRGLVAVATGGTALTADHLATLDAIAPLADRQVLVLMDNDPAGDTAAVAARTVLATAGIQNPVTIVPLPVKDASQLLQDHGPAALRAALADRRPLEDLVVDRIYNLHTAQWPQQIGLIETRLNILDSAAPQVAAMSAQQQHRQALRLAHKLNLSTLTVLDHLDQHRPTPPPLPPSPPGDLGLPTPPVLHTHRDQPTQPAPTEPHRPEQPGAVAPLDDPTPPPRVHPSTPENSPAARDAHSVTDAPAPGDLAAASPTLEVEPDTADAAPAAPGRPYQDLPDTDLAAAAQAAAHEAQHAHQAAAHAHAEALATADAVTAGNGPATAQLDQDTARHQQYLADIATFQQHLQDLRELQAQHRDAAGDLYDATTALAPLGRFAGRRKAELADRITQIHTEQATRLQHIAATAHQVGQLQDRLGATPRQAQQRIHAAHTHLTDRQQLHAHAVEQDRQLAAHTAQHAQALTTAAAQAADQAARYTAELRHRAGHPDAAVPDPPTPAAAAQTPQNPGVDTTDEEYNPALDWTYRPEIHDQPPTPDHGIQR